MNEHQLIHIEKILVNPENPRHTQIMMPDQIFIMQQLVRNAREAKAMYKLMCDIYENEWYPQSIVTLTYDDKQEKFIAWDGNRRLTAMKILKAPKLVESFRFFSYTQRRSIYAMSAEIREKEENDYERFFRIPCYVAESLEACSEYIRNIHTTDTGALKWDMAAIRRFENKLGNKNLFSQLQKFCPKAFDSIGNDFPVTKFERIVGSKVGKDYLKITYYKGLLLTSPKNDQFDKRLTRIVNDIVEGKITAEIIKSNENIKRYLYQDKYRKNNNDEKEKYEQIDLLQNSKKRNVRLIRKDDTILFRNIDCKNLDYSNERAEGVKRACREIQYMSIIRLHKICPMAYCFLIRCLLEQSIIYFLINIGKWEKWKTENNNKELRLESIINRISRDKQNLISDATVSRAWETCFNNEGMKNYLDLVMHHPHKVIANTDVIKSMADMGLFAIIQFFINN